MRYFLLSWDREGFECIQDVTQYHPDKWGQQQLMDLLRDNSCESNPIGRQIHHMKLRAQFNQHRDPEIYLIEGNDNIVIDDLQTWSLEDPQSLVNWVRQNHYHCVVKKQQSEQRVVIK
jgi:hypothetical protein